MPGAEECLVAVGSENPVKVNAVRRAFRVLCNAQVRGVAVESGVPSQPVGFMEVARGAANRAVNALKLLDADYGVGVEAGLVDTPLEPVELQVAVIVDRSGRMSIGLSQGFMLPREWAARVRKRVELGAIASEATGRAGIGEKLGIIGYLTMGLVTRTDLTLNAVIMALIPWLNPELYPSLPSVEEIQGKS